MNNITQLSHSTDRVLWKVSSDEGTDRNYTYTHATTERQFEVRLRLRADGASLYFLCEMRPNGRMFAADGQGNLIRAWDEPRIKTTEAKVGPNALLPTLRNTGIDPEAMIYVGDGFSVNSLYHDSLDLCSRAAARALEEDTRYLAYRELSEEEQASLQHLQAIQSAEYWRAEAHALRRAEQKGRGLFKGCYNALGVPLDLDIRVGILNYLNAPTRQRWLDIRSIVITGHTTLWQAWCALDPSAPRSGQNGFPLPDVLKLAIRESVTSRKRQIEKKLQEVGSLKPRTV